MTAGRPRIALIAGPTASGKSAAAMAIAERHGGVVVNADASQVYRDLRVLTARPSAEDEARVAHRLFGHVDAADDGYSAARWAADAKAAIADIHASGRLPVLVGGTGLYLRTLLDGIAPVPAIDPAIRAEVRSMPVDDAYRALTLLDAEGAARLNPADTTRVARALEVFRSTGRSIRAWQATRDGGIGAAVDVIATILLPDRTALDERIATRAAAMIDGGAVEEVTRLLARDDVPPAAPARRAIGVDAVAALIAWEITRSEAIGRIVQDTRRYAKRQFTWFRHQPPDTWPHAMTPESAVEEVAIRLRV